MSDYGWSRGDEREGQGEDDTWASVTNCNENSDVDGLRIVNDGIMKVGEHCEGTECMAGSAYLLAGNWQPKFIFFSP